MNTGWKVDNVHVLAENARARTEVRSLTHETGPSLPDFLVYSLKNFVQVVGINPTGKLVLIKEDRKIGGWSVEAVAGDIDDHEPPAAAALREFQEETGYHALEIADLGPHQPDTNRGASLSPSSHCWTGHLFVVSVAHHNAPQRAADEIIETVEVSFADAFHCVMNPSEKLPGLNLPILSTGTQSIIKSIRLRENLYNLVR